MKMLSGKTWPLKQMEIFRHNLQDRFDRLCNEGKKDYTISFEELGMDNLLVDEGHAYKNKYSYRVLHRGSNRKCNLKYHYGLLPVMRTT